MFRGWLRPTVARVTANKPSQGGGRVAVSFCIWGTEFPAAWGVRGRVEPLFFHKSDIRFFSALTVKVASERLVVEGGRGVGRWVDEIVLLILGTISIECHPNTGQTQVGKTMKPPGLFCRSLSFHDSAYARLSEDSPQLPL